MLRKGKTVFEAALNGSGVREQCNSCGGKLKKSPAGFTLSLSLWLIEKKSAIFTPTPLTGGRSPKPPH
jgi:hypothetical protein